MPDDDSRPRARVTRREASYTHRDARIAAAKAANRPKLGRPHARVVMGQQLGMVRLARRQGRLYRFVHGALASETDESLAWARWVRDGLDFGAGRLAAGERIDQVGSDGAPLAWGQLDPGTTLGPVRVEADSFARYTTLARRMKRSRAAFIRLSLDLYAVSVLARLRPPEATLVRLLPSNRPAGLAGDDS